MQLRDVRRRYGLSQTAVAGLGGLSVNTLSAGERGYRFNGEQKSRIVSALTRLGVRRDEVLRIEELRAESDESATVGGQNESPTTETANAASA